MSGAELVGLLARVLGDAGLSPKQIETLAAVKRLAPVKVHVIKTDTGVSSACTLAALIEAGYVQRLGERRAAQACDYGMTPEGESALAEVVERVTAAVRRAVNGRPQKGGRR